jgi:hypothetical protein
MLNLFYIISEIQNATVIIIVDIQNVFYVSYKHDYDLSSNCTCVAKVDRLLSPSNRNIGHFDILFHRQNYVKKWHIFRKLS